jgi:acyl carrier protein
MSEELHGRVRNFILENFLFTDDVTRLAFDDSLLDRGIIDSTGMLEIIMFIEEQLGVPVADREMVRENFDSVSNIVRFVERKRQTS